MASNYTRLADTVSADSGNVFATIDGQNREMFEVQNARAQIDLIVQERRMRGHKMTQHKVVGATGTGTLTMYFMNSQQLNSFIEYMRTNRWKPMKLQVWNQDEQSTVGRQEVVMENVILATIPVMAIEESDDPITFDSDFTFDGVENLSSFQLPANYR